MLWRSCIFSSSSPQGGAGSICIHSLKNSAHLHLIQMLLLLRGGLSQLQGGGVDVLVISLYLFYIFYNFLEKKSPNKNSVVFWIHGIFDCRQVFRRFPTFTVHLVDSPEKYKINTATKQLRGMIETQRWNSWMGKNYVLWAGCFRSYNPTTKKQSYSPDKLHIRFDKLFSKLSDPCWGQEALPCCQSLRSFCEVRIPKEPHQS